MGMPVTVEILDAHAAEENIEEVFEFFTYIDNKFSVYKKESEISLINRNELKEEDYSEDMQKVLELSEQSKKLTNGFFDIKTPSGKLDPSGLVKGWAIKLASEILSAKGFGNYYIEAGGDVQARREDLSLEPWTVGIKNPFQQDQIVKILNIRNEGVATSGTYIRGQHIYDPFKPEKQLKEIVSITVVGPDIYQADRMATAAFAMGDKGILFIESLPGLEGYQIDRKGIASYTKGFNNYVKTND